MILELQFKMIQQQHNCNTVKQAAKYIYLTFTSRKKQHMNSQLHKGSCDLRLGKGGTEQLWSF